ncbi:MAG: hypothetical protein V4629_00560 [Pseudomonadota bacterium]
MKFRYLKKNLIQKLLYFIGLILADAGLVGCGAEVGSQSQTTDAVIVDYPIAYIRRTLDPTDEENRNYDWREPFEFQGGAGVYLRDRASPTATSRNITDAAFRAEDGSVPSYDVKDLSVSPDGENLIFSMRASDDENTTWNIWEYSISTKLLRRIIQSNSIAELGHDINPMYLPNGEIIFSSTRQVGAGAILLDEGKPQYSALDENRNEPASVLHRMSASGTDIEQLTFNLSHDLNPTLMSDGWIVFSRWNRMGATDEVSLYRMRPDGTSTHIYYGRHSHESTDFTDALQLTKPLELESTEILAAWRPFNSTIGNWLFTKINSEEYIDNTQPLASLNGLTGPAQTVLRSSELINEIASRGRILSVNPLYDGTQRLLVNWGPCLLQIDSGPTLPCSEENLANQNAVEVAPAFGVWIFDPSNDTLLPIVLPNSSEIMTEVVAIKARNNITELVDNSDLNEDLAELGLAKINIRSVYDFAGEDTANPSISVVSDPAQRTASQREARFIRIVKGVPLPDDDIYDFRNTAYGRSQQQLMREIIGYVPIEPDGSVQFLAPANVPLAFSVVDVNTQRVGARHQNWISVRPGETLECKGCHVSSADENPHGRPDAEPVSANPGASTTGLAFPNTRSELFANIGETMAEVYARINTTRTPNVNVQFEDEWTDPNLRAVDAAFEYAYSDLTTAAPTSDECIDEWTTTCRIRIHYPTHIAPLWNVDRTELDQDGITVLADNTCTSCHSTKDAMDNNQVPAGQLDLTNSPSSDQADHLISYRELAFPDNEQELNGTILIDRLVPVLDDDGNPVFQTNNLNELILDAFGNPIPLTQVVAIEPPISTGAARLSRFFTTVRMGGGTVDHRGFLSDAELRLITEWNDIGAQYYNDPFAAPSD